MSSTLMPPVAPPQINRTPAPRLYRWTCDEFHQLMESGRFEGRHPMLIDGAILEQGPMNPPHAISLELVVDRLRGVFGAGWRWRAQLPLVLSLRTDPEPDIAILPGNPRDTLAHPTTANLVVELADATLAYDRVEKASLYAAGSIADYWVVDLVNRQLLVFRDPQPDKSQPFGYVYRQVSTFRPADSVAPLAAPGSPITVGDLLP